MVDRFRQMLCGFHGHDSLLQFEQDRISLRCVSCGHETPGWDLRETPRAVTPAEPTTAPALVTPHLMSERRVA